MENTTDKTTAAGQDLFGRGKKCYDAGDMAGAREYWLAAAENGDKNAEAALQWLPDPDFEIENGELIKYKGKGTNVTIPSIVKKISMFAFSHCKSLKSITIPNSVTSIRCGVFSGCSGLESITVASGNKKYCSVNNCLIDKVNRKLVSGCKNSVIPSDGSVTIIGDNAFSGCKNLASVTIPDGVMSISSWAFSDCSSLVSITIPNSVTSIGSFTFWGCSSLTNVVIPNGVPNISRCLFYGCKNLSSITIPNSVSRIGDFAFDGCSSLASITIPSSVVGIGDRVFHGCSSLSSINIPSNVTSINSWAFLGCSGLESITVASDNERYYSVCNCLIDKEKKKLVLGCKNSIIPPDGSVTKIGDFAFDGCSGLASITIPSSVTSISGLAFNGCSGLESITVENGNKRYCSVSNCLIDKKTKTLVRGCQNSVIPPDGSVTKIGDCAFDGCSRLASITIPDGVTSIGECSFDDCKSLANVTIPDSVTSIDDNAFSDCDNITSISIPNSVTNMAYSIFSNCNKLTDIYCEAECKPDGWNNRWLGDCKATVHWGRGIPDDDIISKQAE